MPQPERIVLVDGFAQVYRAFYAIPGLTNPRGEPTNALYGVARLLLKLEQEYPHQFGAVVFDRGRPARRMELLPAYKQNRPPMPDDLRAQVEPIRRWIEASGWALVQEDGREADDLIAAIVQVRDGRETAIVSHDKDLTQLVTLTDVYLLQPGAKGRMERVGPAEVTEKYGVPPGAVRDYLVMLGDSSDNIPGVPKVGSKTAAALLQQFGSIDAMLARLDDVPKESIRESLKASQELIRRNIELVSLDLRLPPDWAGIQGLRKRVPDWETLLGLCRDNGFNSLLPLLDKARQEQREPSLF